MIDNKIQKYFTDNPNVTFIKHTYRRFTNVYSTKSIYQFVNSKIVIHEDDNLIKCMNKIILDYNNKNIKGIALFMVKDTFNIDHLTYDYDELQSIHQVQLLFRYNIEYLLAKNTIMNNINPNKLILPHIYEQFVPSLINVNHRKYKFIFILDTDVPYHDYLMIKYLVLNDNHETNMFRSSSHEYLNRRIVTHSYTLSNLSNTIQIETGMSMSYMIITTSKFTSDFMNIYLHINTDNDRVIAEKLLPSEIDGEYDLRSCNFDTYIYDGNSNINKEEYQPTSSIFVKDNSVVNINIADILINTIVNVTYVMYDIMTIKDSNVKLLYKHSTSI